MAPADQQTMMPVMGRLGRQLSNAPRRASGEDWCLQTEPLDGVYLRNGSAWDRAYCLLDFSRDTELAFGCGGNGKKRL